VIFGYEYWCCQQVWSFLTIRVLVTFGQGLWCLVKGCGVLSRVVVFGQGLRYLVKGCAV